MDLSRRRDSRLDEEGCCGSRTSIGKAKSRSTGTQEANEMRDRRLWKPVPDLPLQPAPIRFYSGKEASGPGGGRPWEPLAAKRRGPTPASSSALREFHLPLDVSSARDRPRSRRRSCARPVSLDTPEKKRGNVPGALPPSTFELVQIASSFDVFNEQLARRDAITMKKGSAECGRCSRIADEHFTIKEVSFARRKALIFTTKPTQS